MSGPAIRNNFPSPVVGKTDKQSLNVQRLTTWACEINWGQSNINFQSKGEEANGGFLMVEYHKSSAPISLFPF